ncbi:SURF1 family protein [Pseudoxanthomonas dokdonensis]|uniref:SURF1-like protein n=1 Tax=Pseudoxanthomonas dokdonensis TaxID=344882 RepID=A0A0R0CF05_9GAMM|nr:SURF1 family protein [Pseudoxanthomonas dokdonensis]KRG68361.1 hypothetical protein ABB29_13670 [Pseudoxanthomonas dokdonensis]
MSRRTMPLAVGWLLAALVIVGFCMLGNWQLHRASQKQAMLADAQQVLSRRVALPLTAANDAQRATRYDWSSGTVALLPTPVFLDNRIHEGRPGVQLYCLARPSGQSFVMLIDAGWLPLGDQRALPDVRCPTGAELTLRGLLAPPPAAGMTRWLASPTQQDQQRHLVTHIDVRAIGARLAPGMAVAPRVLRLDPALRVGGLPADARRDLEILPNTIPPQRHLGYAVQWFGLALAVLITALLLSWRGRRARQRAH